MRPILMTQFNRIATTGEVTPVIAAWHEALAKRGISYKEWATFYQEMNHVIRAVANETGALLIDLDQAVPKTAEYIFDHVHLNDKGSVLVANQLARELAEVYGHHACSADDCGELPLDDSPSARGGKLPE